MLRALIVIAGLFLGAAALSQPQGGADAAWLVGISLAMGALAGRLGWLDHRAGVLLWAEPSSALRRAGARIAGALAVAQTTISGDVRLAPGLVRVRTRAVDPREAALFTARLASLPGAMPLDAGPEGVLMHVLDEERLEPSRLAVFDRPVAPSPEPSP